MPLNDATKDILAGTTGGVAQVLVGQPFDIVKVRVQTAPHGTYSGILDCVSHILRDEGPLAFYKGTTMPLIGVGACVSIQFGVVQWSKRLFASMNAKQSPTQQITPLQQYTAGLLGGVANSWVAGPVEHVRIRMQTQKGHDIRGPFDCVRQIVQKAGVTGVFRGMGPTLLREGHGMGVYFLTYEYIVQQRLKALGISRDQVPISTSMVAGGLSGILLGMMIYPIDVVKSYMQTDAIEPSKRQFRSSLDVVRYINASYGLKGYVRGIEPTLLRAPFVNAATFVAFERTYLTTYIQWLCRNYRSFNYASAATASANSRRLLSHSKASADAGSVVAYKFAAASASGTPVSLSRDLATA